MPRTPTLHAIRQLFRDFQKADASGESLSQLVEGRAAAEERVRREGLPRRGPSRRQFVVGGAAAAAGTMMSLQLGRAQGAPRIAIVGGGISGLSAALTLADAGYASTVYEALPNRVGGRMMSDRPLQPACGGCHSVSRPVGATWADNQYTDVFGELIDSDHATIQSLANRFGLGLTDLVAAQPAGSTDTYYFFDQRYSAAQAQADFSAIYRTLRSDVNAAGYPTTWDSSRATASSCSIRRRSRSLCRSEASRNDRRCSSPRSGPSCGSVLM